MIVFIKRNEGLLVIAAPVILVFGTVALALLSSQQQSVDFSHSLVGAFFGAIHWAHSPYINWIATPIIATGLMVMMNRIIAEQGILERLTNLPLFVFAVLFFLVPIPFQNVIFWLSSLLLLSALSQVFDIVNEKNVDFATFNGAFILGLATILNMGFVVFVLAIFLALFIANQQTLRRLFLILIGFLTPLYLLLGMYYLTSTAGISVIMNQINVNPGLQGFSWTQFLILYLILSNVVIMIFRSKSITMKQKRLDRFTALLLLISVCSLFVLPADYFEGVILIPLTIAASNALTGARNNLSARIQLYSIMIVVAINLIY